MTIKMIYATSKNGVIGKDGKLPWHLPEDLKRFKQLTEGNVVLMGRKTWESIPDKYKPLPNRFNIVVSKTLRPRELPESVYLVKDLQKGISAGGPTETNLDLFIIGGSSLYNEGLKYANELYVTNILQDFEGDAFAPVIPMDEWELKSMDSSTILTSVTGLKYRFINYIRKTPALGCK